MTIAACTAFASLDHFEEWFSHHKRVGIRHVFAHTDGVEVANVLQQHVRSGTLTLLRGTMAFTDDARLQIVHDPIVRRWGGQLEFLQQCIAEALDRRGFEWLINIDADEYAMPADPVRAPTIPAALLPVGASACLLIRRHNFLTHAAPTDSLLSTALRRAVFPPPAPRKGERRHGHGLSQPLHPKWLLNLRRAHEQGWACA